MAALAAAVSSIAKDLGYPVFLMSRIMPYYMIPYGAGALLYAPLSEKITFKKILMGSMVVYGLASLLCIVSSSLGVFLFARVLSGVAGASVIPLGLILVGKMFEKTIRGRLVGLLFTSAFISSLAGTFLSGVVNWRFLFAIPALLAFGMAGWAFRFDSSYFNTTQKRKIHYLKVFKHSQLRKVFLFIFVISMLYHGVHKWLGVYFDQVYQMKQFLISSLFILITLGGALGQNIGGWIADKRGRTRACYLGIILLSVGTMLLSGVFPLIILSGILLVFSMGWTIGHNGVSTVLTDFADDYREEIASLNSSVRFLSGGIGFFLSGFFIEKSFQLTFLGIGIVLFLLSLTVKHGIPETLTDE